MTILILGATGFIGSAVLNRAQAMGLDVVATTRVETQGFSVCDVTKPGEVAALFEEVRPSVVINASGAGVTPGSALREHTKDVNEIGSRNVLLAIAELGSDLHVKVIHLASSRDRSGAHRHDDYLEAKDAATRYFLDAITDGAPGISLEVFNTYGLNQPAGRLVAQLAVAAISREPFRLATPFQVRDFVHVSDVAEAVVRAAQSDIAPQQSIEIGTGVGTSVLELARMVYALAGAPQELIQFDPDAGAGRPEVADLSMATELLGWEPSVDLMSGLTEQLLAPRQAAQGQAAQGQDANAPSAGSIREAMCP
jgi:UDP-glucose 4-epimerase